MFLVCSAESDYGMECAIYLRIVLYTLNGRLNINKHIIWSIRVISVIYYAQTSKIVYLRMLPNIFKLS